MIGGLFWDQESAHSALPALSHLSQLRIYVIHNTFGTSEYVFKIITINARNVSLSVVVYIYIHVNVCVCLNKMRNIDATRVGFEPRLSL